MTVYIRLIFQAVLTIVNVIVTWSHTRYTDRKSGNSLWKSSALQAILITNCQDTVNAAVVTFDASKTHWSEKRHLFHEGHILQGIPDL